MKYSSRRSLHYELGARAAVSLYTPAAAAAATAVFARCAITSILYTRSRMELRAKTTTTTKFIIVAAPREIQYSVERQLGSSNYEGEGGGGGWVISRSEG